MKNRVFFTVAAVAIVHFCVGCKSTEIEHPNDREKMRRMIQHYICTIDDNPAVLHRDFTPSVMALQKFGEEALPSLVPLMLSESDDTRLRAYTVIRAIFTRVYRSESKAGLTPEEILKGRDQLWTELGDFKYNQSLDDRIKAAGLWLHWLEQRKKN